LATEVAKPRPDLEKRNLQNEANCCRKCWPGVNLCVLTCWLAKEVLMIRLISLLTLCLTVSAVLASAPPTDKPPIYNESADAKVDVAAAVARAKQENKRVLLDIGANWCGWCYLLHDVFDKDKQVHPIINAEYEVVMIDMGRTGKNSALLATYGIEPKGYPYLAVLDADNKLVTQQETGALEDGPKHDPAKVAAFLNKWKAEPQDANQVLADALAKAKADDKQVFLRFGAPWCGWCHRLDAVLQKPGVASALEADFVVIKIDTQRMKNGAEVAKQYQTSGGIPWYAILSPDGKVISNSDLTPGNNIGFPTEPAEVDHVVKMFTDGRKHMTDEQAKALRETIAQAAAEVKAKMSTH
jgi:thiol:disulfide interchange protein